MSDEFVTREPHTPYIAVALVYEEGSGHWRYYPDTEQGEQNARRYALGLAVEFEDDRDFHVTMFAMRLTGAVRLTF